MNIISNYEDREYLIVNSNKKEIWNPIKNSIGIGYRTLSDAFYAHQPDKYYFGCFSEPHKIICDRCERVFLTWDEDLPDDVIKHWHCPWCHPDQVHIWEIIEKTNKLCYHKKCRICGYSGIGLPYKGMIEYEEDK